MTLLQGLLCAVAILLQATAPIGTEVDTPVDRVADALAAGEAATIDGNSMALVSAARRLDRLAAHPAEREDDLATRWRLQGLSPGAKDIVVPTRGRTLGPAYRSGNLAAGGRVEIEQIFFGGEAAVIVVVPQTRRSLQISVSDHRGKQICDQIVISPKTSCRWLPIFTTRFRISVINIGGSPVRYYFVSN